MPQQNVDRNVTIKLEIPFEHAVQGTEKTVKVRGGKEKFKLKIPPGTKDGDKLRIPGKGKPANKGTPPGDLIILISVLPDQNFNLDGNNVKCIVKVPFFRLILGGEIRVPTLVGKARVKILPNTSPGAKIRLQGKGVPIPGNFGDLVVQLEPDIPSKLTKKQKKLMKELAMEFENS